MSYNLRTIKAALLRTADWLEQHPDKHIAGNFATDDDLNEVNCRADEATCFCALGRLMVELDVPVAPYAYDYWGTVDEVCHTLKVTPSTIWNLNDDGCKANPEVITFLRELAA